MLDRREMRLPFTDEEVVYLRSQGLARLATVADDGQPDVVSVAYEFDGESFWVGGSGHAVRDTRRCATWRPGTGRWLW